MKYGILPLAFMIGAGCAAPRTITLGNDLPGADIDNTEDSFFMPGYSRFFGTRLDSNQVGECVWYGAHRAFGVNDADPVVVGSQLQDSGRDERSLFMNSLSEGVCDYDLDGRVDGVRVDIRNPLQEGEQRPGDRFARGTGGSPITGGIEYMAELVTRLYADVVNDHLRGEGKPYRLEDGIIAQEHEAGLQRYFDRFNMRTNTGYYTIAHVRPPK